MIVRHGRSLGFLCNGTRIAQTTFGLPSATVVLIPTSIDDGVSLEGEAT